MTTIEMIDRIQSRYPTMAPAWHELQNLKARVMSERAALQDAVEEIAKFDTGGDCPHEKRCEDCLFEKEPFSACMYLYIVHKHTGVRHGE
jgi:hypothetical protein